MLLYKTIINGTELFVAASCKQEAAKLVRNKYYPICNNIKEEDFDWVSSFVCCQNQ